MASPEQQPHIEQPAVSYQMEHVVKKLGDAYSVDLSQPGAQLSLDIPTRSDRWMITNLHGQIVLARAFEQEDGALVADNQMVFSLRPEETDVKVSQTSEGNTTIFERTTTEEELKGDMVTVAQAAAALGLTPDGINRIINIGKAKSERRRVTIQFQREITVVSIDDLLKYRASYGRLGRPKKKR